MKTVLENPHFTALKALLKDEGLGKSPIGLNTLLAIPDEKLRELITDFPFLTESRQNSSLAKIILAGIAQEVSEKLIQRVSI